MYPVSLKLKVLLLSTISFAKVKSDKVFPDNLKFGVASAAFQIEGGWNVSGKGESIWDRLMHEHPEVVLDNRNGDVACDSYHLWKTDVKYLKELGVNYYRFSISWPRLLPTGFPRSLNHSDGVRYYNNLIDSLIANGIEPMVTLYHWDLPIKFQELGGWTSLNTADLFADYTRVVFSLFGDRVKKWITINEPSTICVGTYEDNDGAPIVFTPGIGNYLCGKTILLAHAKAYHIYDKEFRPTQKGKIGITLESIWPQAASYNQSDLDAAERELQMSLGWWANPIFSKDGDYPHVMRSRIDDRSRREKYIRSRLPSFTKEEINTIKGTADFFGLNFYFTWPVVHKNYPIGQPSFMHDKGLTFDTRHWTPNNTVSGWALHQLLNWIKKEYDNPLIYITENGHADRNGLKDSVRMEFHKEILQGLTRAINDGCNVQAYTIWSFMDNLEWRDGYTVKFGIIEVDFNSPNRTRTPKASFHFFKDIIKTRKIPMDLDVYMKAVP